MHQKMDDHENNQEKTDNTEGQSEAESFFNSVNNLDGLLNPQEYNYQPSTEDLEAKTDRSPAKSLGFLTRDIPNQFHFKHGERPAKNTNNKDRTTSREVKKQDIERHDSKSTNANTAKENNKSKKKSGKNSPAVNNINFVDKNHAENLMRCFDDLRKKSLFTDVILDVANTEFPAHRVVLVSGSEYFKKMFCTDHRASKQMMIQITGLSADVMEMLLTYLYTSKIKITKENVKLLLQATDLFKVNTLKSACISFMLQNLTLANALSTLSHAENHNYTELADKARDLLEKNFENFVKSDDFLKSSKNQLIKLFKNNNILAANEEMVFEAAVTWLMHKPESRKDHFGEILKYVRLPLLHPHYFMSNVETNKYILESNDDEIVKYMLESRMYHMMGKEPEFSECAEEVAIRYKPRKCNDLGQLIVVLSGQDRITNGWMLPTLEAFDANTCEWFNLSKFPAYVKQGYAVCGFHNKILVTGGKTISKDCWLYSLEKDAWDKISEMQQGRSCHNLTYIEGSVYALGGMDLRKGRLSSCERYDIFQSRWIQVPDIPSPISDVKACTYKKMIICFGVSNKAIMLPHLLNQNPNHQNHNHNIQPKFGNHDPQRPIEKCHDLIYAYHIRNKFWIELQFDQDFELNFITNLVSCQNVIYFSDIYGNVFEWTLPNEFDQQVQMISNKNERTSKRKNSTSTTSASQIGSQAGNNDENMIFTYKIQSKHIKKLNFDLEIDSGFAITSGNGKIYISGGKISNSRRYEDDLNNNNNEQSPKDSETTDRNNRMTGSSEKSHSNNSITEPELVSDFLCYNPDTSHISDIAVLTKPLFHHFSTVMTRNREPILNECFRGGFDQLSEEKLLKIGRGTYSTAGSVYNNPNNLQDARDSHSRENIYSGSYTNFDRDHDSNYENHVVPHHVHANTLGGHSTNISSLRRGNSIKDFRDNNDERNHYDSLRRESDRYRVARTPMQEHSSRRDAGYEMRDSYPSQDNYDHRYNNNAMNERESRYNSRNPNIHGGPTGGKSFGRVREYSQNRYGNNTSRGPDRGPYNQNASLQRGGSMRVNNNDDRYGNNRTYYHERPKDDRGYNNPFGRNRYGGRNNYYHSPNRHSRQVSAPIWDESMG